MTHFEWKDKTCGKRKYTPAMDAESVAKRKFPTGKEAFKFETFPVLKFGIDKFICCRLVNDKLSVIIGDFQQGPTANDWTPSQKSVDLDHLQFLKLVGNIIGDFTKIVHDPEVHEDLSSMYDLGGDYYFCWTR